MVDMPYDDPISKELGGYVKAEEPGWRERARRLCVGHRPTEGQWTHAVVVPLFDTAKDHRTKETMGK